MYFWPKIIKINRMCEQPSKEVSLFGPTCTCINTTALLLIPDIFVTAQTALYHCTIASYHCTFCVSLHSILCPAKPPVILHLLAAVRGSVWIRTPPRRSDRVRSTG